MSFWLNPNWSAHCSGVSHLWYWGDLGFCWSAMSLDNAFSCSAVGTVSKVIDPRRIAGSTGPASYSGNALRWTFPLSVTLGPPLSGRVTRSAVTARLDMEKPPTRNNRHTKALLFNIKRSQSTRFCAASKLITAYASSIKCGVPKVVSGKHLRATKVPENRESAGELTKLPGETGRNAG